ncbi:CHAD domain-containing protein [Methylomonas sp. SURF-2]|uniref:CHAD domain-containing protein n=1 Tax=Methylomonas subterranea TaxID=2952225 RepID=A0ABT1TB83_9GAMM|nr:CHAD domain-containing protein [Methylomonas sp. SURF-2]MCQ8102719.1 CHAD domain-containing protein [Methylomonas sp. SURF-2]
MHDGKRLLTSLAKLWQKYERRLSQCRRTADEDAVHKLRISCRRLLALIQLLQALAPHSHLQKLRKRLKSQLDDFDELRDTQVMLLEVTDRLDSLPELAACHRHLQLNEQRLLTQLPSLLRQRDSEDLQPLVEKARKQLRSAFGDKPLTPLVLAAVDNCYREALERHRQTDPGDPATLHSLRIALKKLRYMLASARELLPDLPDSQFDRMQVHLTRLGEIQNSRVLSDNLNRFFGHLPPPAVQTHYQHRHQALLDDYMQHAGEILRFWRAKPDLPFPWQRQEFRP